MFISPFVAAVATFAPSISKSLNPIGWRCFTRPLSKRFRFIVGKALWMAVPYTASISEAGRRHLFQPIN
jgi:hypothetical protein